MAEENTQDKNEREAILRETSTYLFQLMGCALRGVEADPKPDGIEWKHVFRLAMRNSVQGLAWFGAKTQPDLSADLRVQWELEANKVLFKRARFDMERAQILEAMGERSLSYLPLKGVLLADYYPRPEMRAMCDNDILYGYVEPCATGGWQICGATEEEREAAMERGVATMVDIMEARGYRTDNAYKGNHEVFLKAPIFNFEMHRRLASCDSPLHFYYANPWGRACQNADNPHSFRFSDEDEYIYVIVHAFKHFDIAGCGIRIFADIWAFNQAKGVVMDWVYVHEQLEILGIADFERQIREVALEGLNGQELRQDQLELLWYMAGSGTYGTARQRMENAAKKVEAEAAQECQSAGTAKARYLWQRMFGTGEDFLKQNFPFFYKHKLARPLFPLYRIFRALTRNQSNTLKEVKTILRSGKE